MVMGTVSLQRYIFQSNRLKENIGASSLAKYWFDEGLVRAFKDASCSFDRSAWAGYVEDPERCAPKTSSGAGTDVSIIYVGGGNAALLCRDEDTARKVVRVWSSNLLGGAPGLRIAAGYGAVSGSLRKAYLEALNDLARCEEALPFGAPLHALPVVRTCITTGLPASEPSWERDEEDQWISRSAARKRRQVGSDSNLGLAQMTIADEFKDVLKGRKFAVDLDSLGGCEGQSHVAVVHADGNGMGELLMNLVYGNADGDEFLHHLRVFSASVSRLARHALEETLKYFEKALQALGNDLSLNTGIFPLRPIVYGGDDLTFVCDGRVGLDLAACYLKKFSEGKVTVGGEQRCVDACAGVAIVPTKFPFARAYGFAEELCGLAKHKRRQKGSTGSWIDFQLVQGGTARSVSALRGAQYRSFEGQTLHQRPYRVPEEWGDFARILKQFQAWPRSRAKGMLEALAHGPVATERFVEGARWRGSSLPECNEVGAKTVGWTGGDKPDRTTPYFDPLEMLDFYLECKPGAVSGAVVGQADAGEGDNK